MTKILVTAFEPYDRWPANSSWLCLQELARDLPALPAVTTRLYPVDFAAARERLWHDLAAGYDFAVHLGQAPGSSAIRLEAIGLNIGPPSPSHAGQLLPLVDAAPLAYRSDLPLSQWVERLAEFGIPAQVSYHAGTYLCNAALYWTLHRAQQMGLRTRAVFVHLPLDVSQVAGGTEQPSLPASTAARAVRLILAELTSPPDRV
ncbi:MAG: pyroglutamyl-peptidase I [Pirellulales bacterium]